MKHENILKSAENKDFYIFKENIKEELTKRAEQDKFDFFESSEANKMIYKKIVNEADKKYSQMNSDDVVINLYKKYSGYDDGIHWCEEAKKELATHGIKDKRAENIIQKVKELIGKQ